MTTDHDDLRVFDEAARIWLAAGPVVAPPRLRIWWKRPLAAALVLVASGWALSGALSDGPPGAVRALTLEVAEAPSGGIFAPPSASQVLAITSAAVEVRVVEAGPGRLVAERTAVLAGPSGDLPERFDLVIPPGVSELEAEEVKARVGETLVVLLSGRPRAWELATGNAWSLVGARSTLFQGTHGFKAATPAQRSAAIRETLALRDRVVAVEWTEQASPLEAALRNGAPLTIDFALGWYAGGRSGRPLITPPDESEPAPSQSALPAVERAVLALALPHGERTYAPTAAAAATLAPRGAAQLTRLRADELISWLSDPPRAEVTTVVLRALLVTNPWDERPEVLISALDRAADGGDATVAYVTCVLLGRDADAAAAGLSEAERARIGEWKRVPGRPSSAFAKWAVHAGLVDER